MTSAEPFGQASPGRWRLARGGTSRQCSQQRSGEREGPAPWVIRRTDGEPWQSYKARAADRAATHLYPAAAHLHHHLQLRRAAALGA